MRIQNTAPLLCQFLVALILLLKVQFTFAGECGKPDYSINDPNAIYLWQNCNDLSWRLDVTGGGGFNLAKGQITTDDIIDQVNGINLSQQTDELTFDDQSIEFSIRVWGNRINGINFSTQSNSRIYLDIDNSAYERIFLGPNKTPLKSNPVKIGGQGKKYNIVFILTDDQRFDTLWAMPQVQQELIQKGINFTESLVTSPLCCPARASILSGGLFDKNTGVYHNFLPNGSFELFDDSQNLGTAMQQAGYRTGIIGKIMNGYPTGYVMPGWDYHVANPGPTQEDWHSFTATVGSSQGTPALGNIVSPITEYVTDYQKNRAIEFINTSQGDPFFLIVSTYAPHTPATADDNDRLAFSNYSYSGRGVSETDLMDKPEWVWNPNRDKNHKNNDPEFIKQQLASLQSVDRMVGEIVTTLQANGQIDNTIIIFTSDNGYLWGEHGLWKKTHVFEESIRVPLVIRFPDITPREDNRQVAADIDLPAFFLDIANSEFRTDGESVMPLLLSNNGNWRQWLPISLYSRNQQSFAAIRSTQWKYTESVIGDTMLFDLQNDPYELENLAGLPTYSIIETELKSRLDLQKGLTISSVRIPMPIKSSPYATNLTAWGGKPPYSWSVIERPVNIYLGQQRWPLSDVHFPLNIDGGVYPCGEPQVSLDGIKRFYIWKDCNQNNWFVRATSNAMHSRYIGNINSVDPIDSISPYRLSTKDKLTLTNSTNIDFEGVLEILCQFFNLEHNTMRRIDYDRQIRFQ